MRHTYLIFTEIESREIVRHVNVLNLICISLSSTGIIAVSKIEFHLQTSSQGLEFKQTLNTKIVMLAFKVYGHV